jgi:hypothetical protein
LGRAFTGGRPAGVQGAARRAHTRGARGAGPGGDALLVGGRAGGRAGGATKCCRPSGLPPLREVVLPGALLPSLWVAVHRRCGQGPEQRWGRKHKRGKWGGPIWAASQGSPRKRGARGCTGCRDARGGPDRMRRAAAAWRSEAGRARRCRAALWRCSGRGGAFPRARVRFGAAPGGGRQWFWGWGTVLGVGVPARRARAPIWRLQRGAHRGRANLPAPRAATDPMTWGIAIRRVQAWPA